ncbi:MobA/MobL family protein [Azohydromonas sp. G-1-1-14]|uniref:MobA/MobL family protein n=1 Tax=Azohydromonas caseinilytica TaxID=2728836 RepID=A0A848FLD6_9BURK|nr:MobA/MobL family protein [Azohydromonas caseinilytica]
MKTVSRSAGRSAVAAVAYRTAERLVDQRTGELHDYRRKGGVEFTELFLPKGAPEWAHIREVLWNAAEQAENRKNSTVAREFEIALPAELSAQQRERLARDLAREIVERHGCAVDLAIHAPGKAGDNRNHHAHVLLTTRRLGPQGFTEKTRELDDRKSREVDRWRERFAQLQNERLREYGHETRVDHRSLEAQGIDRQATRHLGPTAAAIERRTEKPSRKRLEFEREVAERLTQAKEAGELERQARAVDRSILDLSGDLKAALQEREREQRQEQERRQSIEEAKRQAAAGVAEFREQFRLHQAVEAGKRAVREEVMAELQRQAAERAAERERQAQQQREREQEQQRQAERQQPQRGRKGPSPGY